MPYVGLGVGLSKAAPPSGALPPSGDFLLLEDGFYLLLEDGFKVILDA